MPELPEVQTTLNYLEPAIVGNMIQQVIISEKGASHFNRPVSEVKAVLEGRRILSLNRIGKWILMDLENIKAVAHLRMSGRFLITKEISEHPHNRFQFIFENDTILNYIDQRRFGTFHLIDDWHNHPALQSLGPDALSLDLTPDYLYSQLQRRNKSIYSTLLDQQVIAGLGNIYVNEVLYLTGIHPLLPAREVTQKQADLLVRSIQQILGTALKFKGTTLIDNLYKDPEGNDGSFAKMLNVYGKKQDPKVISIKIGGRTVFFNPEVQPIPST